MLAASGPCSPPTCEPIRTGRAGHGRGVARRQSPHMPLSLSYSIVIEGERGNRQRIYSLEQLLQEAVRAPYP